MLRRTKFLVASAAAAGLWQVTTAQPPPAPAPPVAPIQIPAASFTVIQGGMQISQPPSDSGGDRRGGGRMGGMMGGDPMEMFNRISGGKDVITRDALDDRAKFLFDMMARTMNVTNGQITRDQFKQGAEQMRARFGGGGGPGGGGGSMTPQQQDEFAVDRFRKADRNNDGFISQDEMSDRLKPVWQQYDANKDGMLDLNEFKGYMKSFFAQQQSNEPTAATAPAITIGADGKATIALTPGGIAPVQDAPAQQDEEAKPTVFRAGKLPKDIPSWFDQIDADKDGQIGLYEWVKASRTLDEFRAMDRNDDGFVTIDEVMSYVRNGNKPTAGTALVSASAGGEARPDSRSRGDNGGAPGGGFRNMGKGGDNGGGFRGMGKGDRWERPMGKGKGGDNGNAVAPTPAVTPPPPADQRKPDGGGKKNRDEKFKSRQP